MAIDLTGPNRFATNTSVGTTCTLIQAPPGYVVKIFADGALHVFSGVADGEAAPGATERIAYTATEMESGVSEPTGGPEGQVSGRNYAGIGVAAASGTVTVRTSCYPARAGL